MKSHIVLLFIFVLGAIGCGAATTGTGSSEFNTALKKMRAVTSVGANQQEFRTALQTLAGASDGSQRADQIIGIYKDSLDLWDLMNSKAASDFKIAGQTEYRGGVAVPIKDDNLSVNEVWRDEKRNCIAAICEILKRHRDIVRVESSLTEGESRWIIRPDAVQQMWAKAAKM